MLRKCPCFSVHLSCVLLASSWIDSAAGLRAATYEPCSVTAPKPAREFRAAWVATVGNIDWPSQKGLSTADQKAELLAILDRAAQLKLNAVILQVRPACDALYASQFEPWSEYLTGTMGKAPQPFYDPLAFAVEEAHKRGLELHAWFNPYRARAASVASPAAPNHISKTRPQLVRQYGKLLWLDPGEKEVQDYSVSVIMDVVRRYDIDGVHFDDYFYPYKEKDASGNEMDFPDDSTWRRFGAGGKLPRDDWRRENVNTFVYRVYQSIKAAKPWVKFGISPFGIWRPGFPSTQIQGHDAYAKLYADSRKWLANGWLDYFSPQLYWAIDAPEQSFPVLLKWWDKQNGRGRHIWPGLDSTKTSVRRRLPLSPSDGEREGVRGSAPRWQPEEIIAQIRLTRHQPGSSGHIHWNMRTLMRNTALDDALARELYTEPALVPASPWLGAKPPAKPALSIADSGGTFRASWVAPASEKPWQWLLQTQNATGEWKTEILPAHQTARTFENSNTRVIALSVVDRFGNTSTPAAMSIKQQPPARQAITNQPAPSQPLATAPTPSQSTPKLKRAKKLASPKGAN